MLRKFAWPLVIIISAITAGLLVMGGMVGVLRQLVLAWFILVCPGMAIIRLLHLGDALTEVGLAAALSLVLATLVAEVFLLTHRWSPTGILSILIVISLAGALLKIKNTLRTGAEAGQAS